MIESGEREGKAIMMIDDGNGSSVWGILLAFYIPGRAPVWLCFSLSIWMIPRFLDSPSPFWCLLCYFTNLNIWLRLELGDHFVCGVQVTCGIAGQDLQRPRIAPRIMTESCSSKRQCGEANHG